MNDFVTRPAAIQVFTVAREFEAVERLANVALRHNFGQLQVHDSQLVFGIAAVKDRSKPAIRMNGNINWKIA